MEAPISTTREDWINTALRILIEQGAGRGQQVGGDDLAHETRVRGLGGLGALAPHRVERVIAGAEIGEEQSRRRLR